MPEMNFPPFTPLRRRRLLAAAGGLACLALSGPARAQADWARVAVPAYAPADILQGLHAFWSVPQAQAFADRAQALLDALRALEQAGAAHVVEIMHQGRVAHEGFGCSHVLDPVAAPQTAGAAKGFQPAFGGNAGTGKDDNGGVFLQRIRNFHAPIKPPDCRAQRRA